MSLTKGTLYLSLVKSHSKGNVAVSTNQKEYPLVIFSHGLGVSKEIYDSFLENLASQGYIVAAVDHTYFTFATVFPDHHVTLDKTRNKYINVSTSMGYCDIVADDLHFVIEKFEQMNLGKTDSILKGRIDVDKIGVLGHSFGGSAAYNLCFTDKRIKAAIDLDGTTYFLPEVSKMSVPFMMIVTPDHSERIKDIGKIIFYKDLDLSFKEYLEKEKVSEEAYNGDTKLVRKLYENLKNAIVRNGFLVTIKGSKHMSFSDIGLYSPITKALGLTGDLDTIKVIEITNSCTLNFFDKYLKSRSTAALENVKMKYKEIILEKLSD